MKLRYYADADIRELHEQILQLLRALHDDHGIKVEIERIDEQHGPSTEFPGEVRPSMPEAVYEHDLKRNRALNQSIEPLGGVQTVREARHRRQRRTRR